MTRLERADELLREAEFFVRLAVGAFDCTLEERKQAQGLGGKIIVHFAEPQSEPEYVWRAWRSGCASYHDTKIEAAYRCDDVIPIERAQIGPWEVCE